MIVEKYIDGQMVQVIYRVYEIKVLSENHYIISHVTRENVIEQLIVSVYESQKEYLKVYTRG